MSGETRVLKLSCIAALFAGIASLVTGILLAVGTALDVDAFLTGAEGLLSAVFGARCAILVNVPSNMAKVRSKALLFALAAVALLAAFLFAGFDVTVVQYALCGFICGLALVAVVFASRILAEQLRK